MVDKAITDYKLVIKTWDCEDLVADKGWLQTWILGHMLQFVLEHTTLSDTLMLEDMRAQIDGYLQRNTI